MVTMRQGSWSRRDKPIGVDRRVEEAVAFMHNVPYDHHCAWRNRGWVGVVTVRVVSQGGHTSDAADLSVSCS